MSQEQHEAVHRLIQEADRPFGDAAQLVSTFAEVARAATRARRATVSLHPPAHPGQDEPPPTGGELLFPITYQEVELGSLCLLPDSTLDPQGAEASRLIAKTLAYHLKRYEVRQLAWDLHGQELDLIGTSPSLRRIDRFVERASQGPLPALILGDFGSEAGAVALALHLAGPGRGGPFVGVHCASFASDGFERQWRSRAHRASGGTLLLHRIEELARPLQARLCEILESGNAGRTRGRDGEWRDLRLVITASLELEQLVRDGAFYPPLLEQIDFLRLEIDPLRERQEDLEPLLEHYLAVRCGSSPPRLSAEVLEVCRAYPWPGNVAEISRIAGRLAVMVEGRHVRLQHVASLAPQLLRPAELSPPTAPPPGASPPSRHPSLQRAIDYIADHFQDKLSLSEVATRAYVSPSHLEHLFRRELGKTFIQFLVQRRIERAQILLLSRPHAAVTSIAGDVGFNDLRHFERTFKSLAGCTPRSFRQRSEGAGAESAASAVVFAVPATLQRKKLEPGRDKSSTDRHPQGGGERNRDGQTR
jgi:DNA-binding NtrC family response regulator